MEEFCIMVFQDEISVSGIFVVELNFSNSHYGMWFLQVESFEGDLSLGPFHLPLSQDHEVLLQP